MLILYLKYTFVILLAEYKYNNIVLILYLKHTFLGKLLVPVPSTAVELTVKFKQMFVSLWRQNKCRANRPVCNTLYVLHWWTPITTFLNIPFVYVEATAQKLLNSTVKGFTTSSSLSQRTEWTMTRGQQPLRLHTVQWSKDTNSFFRTLFIFIWKTRKHQLGCFPPALLSHCASVDSWQCRGSGLYCVTHSFVFWVDLNRSTPRGLYYKTN